MPMKKRKRPPTQLDANLSDRLRESSKPTVMPIETVIERAVKPWLYG